MRRFHPVSAVLFAVAISALVGGLFGRRALAVDDRVPEHYKTFTAALSAIESGYVDKIDSDRLVYGAVRGMLATLDPHSSFFDPREYAQMRERQEGRYYGIGVSIQAADGDITAMVVFEGSPAHKSGHAAWRRHRQDRQRDRQRVDDGAGDAQAPWLEGNAGADRDPPAGVCLNRFRSSWYATKCTS